MWFKGVYLKTLRDYRVAILGWGVGLGLLMYTVLNAIPELIKTPEARQALVALAASFAWLAEPVKVDTAGGYATFKYGFTILVLALWPILVGSRTLRGEEERGSIDVLLSVPHGRGDVALAKVGALLTALLGMGLIIGLLTAAGGAKVNADFGLGGGLLFGLNLTLACAFWGGLALLISQFTRNARSAAGITGGVLLVAILVDALHRVIPSAEALSRLSPVYYYNLSKPLIPSYGTNIGALVVQLVLCVVVYAVALWLFVGRDVGAPVPLPAWLRLPERAPSRDVPVESWSLRSVFGRGIAVLAQPTLWWTLAIAGLAAWVIVIAKQTAANLRELSAGSPFLASILSHVGGGDANSNATLLSFFFVFLPVLLMAFAVTQASRWAADEETGRQELVLATPQSRLTVVLARFGALATATVFICVVTLAVAALSSAASGLTLDGGHLVAATLGMIPLGLLMAAIGYAFAGWLRAAIDTGVLSFLLAFWFFLTFVGPELNWSEGVLRLSPFYYYGTPLLNGLPLLETLGLLAVGVAALVLASVRFMRKDIGR